MSLVIRKLDLHVHTPASHDFIDKTVTPEKIIEHSISVGLDAIAVTDHNTVDYIDKIKSAAKLKKFTIFPGFEISCGGSVNGSIHVIGLFDPSKSKDDLQKVLGKLDVKGGGENALTTKSVNDVIDIIRESGGLSVLAHANSSHGALSDIKGNPRTEMVQNPNLSAVEATSTDFKKEKGKRLMDFLNGLDPVYKRKLPVYKSSDNRNKEGTGHTLEAIGSQFTFFKMGDLTLESLRQCFEDPDSRIIQDFESEKLQSDHSRLISITVSGGFLDKQKVEFHCGMNSIIGGTGTGKSLIVEYLRFAFDRRPTGVLLKEHQEKLNKQLRLGGEVKVVFKDKAGDEYEVTRKYGSNRDPYSNPLICKQLATKKEFKGDVSSIFPLLIYSQNEILEITRDPKAQLSLLDNFRDFVSHQNQLKGIVGDLERLDAQLVQAIQGSINLVDLNKQLMNVEEKIKKIEKGLKPKNTKAATGDYITLSNEKTNIEAKLDEFEPLLERVDELIEEFENDTPQSKRVPKETIEIIDAEITKSYKAVVQGLKKSRQEIHVSKQKGEAELTKWEKANNYADLEKKHHKELLSKTAEQKQETERMGLLKDKNVLMAKISLADKASKTFLKLRNERNTLLSRLNKVKTEYYNERVDQAKLISDKSGNKLEILVHRDEDKEMYRQLLSKLKVGSHAEKKEVESIVNTLSPVELIELVLDSNKKDLAKRVKLTEQKAENIIKELRSQENLLQALSLQYRGNPDDSVEIRYLKKDKSFHNLSELSMGQKADALIMIALGDGLMPVIIDQPEDALDIPSIWTDICTRLRISKHSRQFIFTTHNSSISVSSDSDQFIILEADGTSGWVAQSGAIDTKSIKDEVVGHLEGGYDSYQLKRKKYGL